jgi:hypothetical protein
LENDSEPVGGDGHASDANPSEATPDACGHAELNTNSNCESRRTDKRHPLEWAIAFMLFGTLVATAFAACYTKKQWETAVDNEQRSLRAYVGIAVPSNGPIQRGPATSPTIKLGIKNFGATPAYKMTYETGAAVRPYPIPKDNDYNAIPEFSSHVPITVWSGPLDPVGISISMQLTTDEIARIKDGRAERFYMWGTISYFDAFKRRHFTNYCISFLDISNTNALFESCADHNDSD